MQSQSARRESILTTEGKIGWVNRLLRGDMGDLMGYSCRYLPPMANTTINDDNDLSCIVRLLHTQISFFQKTDSQKLGHSTKQKNRKNIVVIVVSLLPCKLHPFSYAYFTLLYINFLRPDHYLNARMKREIAIIGRITLAGSHYCWPPSYSQFLLWFLVTNSLQMAIHQKEYEQESTSMPAEISR